MADAVVAVKAPVNDAAREHLPVGKNMSA